MRKSDILIFAILFFLVLNISALDVNPEAEEYYIEAMSSLGQGNQKKAEESFEKAVFNDARILIFDDKGLLDAITNRYVRKATDTDDPGVLFKLGYLMRVRGNHDQALYFYELFLQKDSKDRDLVNEARKRVYELSYIKDVMDKKKRQPQSDTMIEPSTDEDTSENKISDAQEEDTDSEDKEKEKLERLISSQEEEIDRLRDQYDLWFSLTYGDHKYKKEEYQKNLMYYYERKLKEAEKKLEQMKSKL